MVIQTLYGVWDLDSAIQNTAEAKSITVQIPVLFQWAITLDHLTFHALYFSRIATELFFRALYI